MDTEIPRGALPEPLDAVAPPDANFATLKATDRFKNVFGKYLSHRQRNQDSESGLVPGTGLSFLTAIENTFDVCVKVRCVVPISRAVNELEGVNTRISEYQEGVPRKIAALAIHYAVHGFYNRRPRDLTLRQMHRRLHRESLRATNREDKEDAAARASFLVDLVNFADKDIFGGKHGFTARDLWCYTIKYFHENFLRQRGDNRVEFPVWNNNYVLKHYEHHTEDDAHLARGHYLPYAMLFHSICDCKELVMKTGANVATTIEHGTPDSTLPQVRRMFDSVKICYGPPDQRNSRI